MTERNRQIDLYRVATSAALVSARYATAAPLGAEDSASTTWQVVRALRPHHWIKNLLVLVPLLVTQDALSLATLGPALLAFAAFSLCASAAYLVNDVLDVEFDRLHPTKRHRPFASGALPTSLGLPLATGCLALGMAAAAALPLEFGLCVVAYVLVTGLYSTRLKRMFFVDVVALTALYSLRLLAGGLAVHVAISVWLLAFAALFFLSLALAKRYAELVRLTAERRQFATGRGYLVSDQGLLKHLGQICGCLAGAALAIFLVEAAFAGREASAAVVAIVTGLYFYWIARLWHRARRGQAMEDPVTFVLHDPLTIAGGAAFLVWLQVPPTL